MDWTGASKIDHGRRSSHTDNSDHTRPNRGECVFRDSGPSSRRCRKLICADSTDATRCDASSAIRGQFVRRSGHDRCLQLRLPGYSVASYCCGPMDGTADHHVRQSTGRTNRMGCLERCGGYLDAWQDNGDPGGSGWWLVLGPASLSFHLKPNAQYPANRS